MKTEKISFKNIKDVLNRDEMKEIMAGSGSTYCGFCNNGNSCYRDPRDSFACKCAETGTAQDCPN